MNKSIIFCLVCILVACQLANCSTHASSRIVSSNMGTSTSLIEEPTRQSSVNNLETTNAISSIAQTKSTFSPLSTKACPCTDCSTDIDKSNNFYSWNVTCADPRNYAYVHLDIGSDNPKELYTVFYLESAEYMKMRLGAPSVYFEQFIVNCLSNRTVFQSSSVIAAYFCTSTDLLNSTICTTKYKFTSGCYIGLNSIGITSNFNGSLLFIQVNLYGNDGLIWTNSDSNVRVSVNGTNYSNVSTLQNLQQGTLIFTFNIPSTTVPYNILVEADDIFGIKSHVGIQEAEFRLAGPSLLVGTGSATTSGGVSSQHGLSGFSFGMILSLLVLLSFISL